MGDNHHPTGGGSFCPSTRCLNDPSGMSVFFDGFLSFNRIEIRNPSIIGSYGYRGLKKKDLAVKRGWTPWAASHFFLAKIWPAHYFAWGVRMWKLVSKVRISGFGYPNFWRFQTWQLHYGGFGFSWNPLDFDFSAQKISRWSCDRSRTIVEKALVPRSRERPKVRWAILGHSKPVQTTACYRHAANHHHDTNRDFP